MLEPVRRGGQSYVNTKVEYLESIGWTVQVFTVRERKDNKILWKNLEKFDNAICSVLKYQPEFYPKKYVNKTLNWMESFINNGYENIIIESHTYVVAEWGELFARQINAKHICFLLDERLEEYKAKEFLYFKYLRNEVAGIHITSMKRLFKGIAEVAEDERYVLSAANSGVVQDIEYDIVKQIPRYDWNIAYVGRDKPYVSSILDGICKFASEYQDKKILLIILGEAKCIDNIIKPSNVEVYKIDFLIPISRGFFSHVDVIIAGSGCAYLSAMEKVPTIVADPKTYLSNGVLGYDVFDTLFSNSEGFPYEESLRKVLVYKSYEQKHFSLPVLKDYRQLYKKHFDFIRASEQKQEYFDFNQIQKKLSIRDMLLRIKLILIYIKNFNKVV